MGRRRWLGRYLLSSNSCSEQQRDGSERMEVTMMGRDMNSNRRVTVKVFDADSTRRDLEMGETVKFEIEVMSRTNGHPNVLELLEVLASPSKIFVVMETVSRSPSDLFQIISSKGRLDDNWARHYFGQLLDAVEHCHLRGVCHRDIKPENVILDRRRNVKLTGFALAGLFDPGMGHDVVNLMHLACGTPDYTAPEVVQGVGYDGRAADVWSLGVTLYAMLAGFLPFEAANVTELFEKAEMGNFSYVPGMTISVRSLLDGMLEPNPSARFTIQQIRSHPWFIQERQALRLPRRRHRRRSCPEPRRPRRMKGVKRQQENGSVDAEGKRASGSKNNGNDSNSGNDDNGDDNGDKWFSAADSASSSDSSTSSSDNTEKDGALSWAERGPPHTEAGGMCPPPGGTFPREAGGDGGRSEIVEGVASALWRKPRKGKNAGFGSDGENTSDESDSMCRETVVQYVTRNLDSRSASDRLSDRRHSSPSGGGGGVTGSPWTVNSSPSKRSKSVPRTVTESGLKTECRTPQPTAKTAPSTPPTVESTTTASPIQGERFDRGESVDRFLGFMNCTPHEEKHSGSAGVGDGNGTGGGCGGSASASDSREGNHTTHVVNLSDVNSPELASLLSSLSVENTATKPVSPEAAAKGTDHSAEWKTQPESPPAPPKGSALGEEGTRVIFFFSAPPTSSRSGQRCMSVLATLILKALESVGCSCRIGPAPTQPRVFFRVKACRQAVMRGSTESIAVGAATANVAAAAVTNTGCDSASSAADKTEGAAGCHSRGYGRNREEKASPFVGIVVTLMRSEPGAGGGGVEQDDSSNYTTCSSKGTGGSSHALAEVMIALNTGSMSEFHLLVQDLLACDVGSTIFATAHCFV